MQQESQRRTVVTGIGAVTPLGVDVETFQVTVHNVAPTIDDSSVVNSSPTCGGAAAILELDELLLLLELLLQPHWLRVRDA